MDRKWLGPARVVWLAVVLPAYALLILQIPNVVTSAFYNPVAGGAPAAIPTIALSLAEAQHLRAFGIQPAVYGTALLTVALLFHLIYATTGALLFWRRADDRIALLASFGLMMLPFGFAPMTLGAIPDGWRWVIPLFAALGNSSIILSGYLFPDGHFRPRWARLLGAGLVVGAIIAAATPASDSAISLWSVLMFLVFALGVLPIQAYRYRVVSTQRQRQQTKWVVWGMSVSVIGDVAARTLYAFVLAPSWGAGALSYATQYGLIMLAMTAVPVSVGVAILSSHLWDIDVVIHRTLVYSALSFSLAIIYGGANIALQALFHGVAGWLRPGPLVITLSTLLVAGLTNPLRRWIQRAIDRRFYRNHFRRRQVLQTFAGAMRHEVEIQQLSERLLMVIEETMRPAHLSVWLPPPVSRAQPHERQPGQSPPLISERQPA